MMDAIPCEIRLGEGGEGNQIQIILGKNQVLDQLVDRIHKINIKIGTTKNFGQEKAGIWKVFFQSLNQIEKRSDEVLRGLAMIEQVTNRISTDEQDDFFNMIESFSCHPPWRQSPELHHVERRQR